MIWRTFSTSRSRNYIVTSNSVLRASHRNVSTTDQVSVNKIVEDNKRLLKKVEGLERNSKPSDPTTTSDFNISVGGGQALKQSKAQVNSKTSINQESSVDSVGL